MNFQYCFEKIKSEKNAWSHILYFESKKQKRFFHLKKISWSFVSFRSISFVCLFVYLIDNKRTHRWHMIKNPMNFFIKKEGMSKWFLFWFGLSFPWAFQHLSFTPYPSASFIHFNVFSFSHLPIAHRFPPAIYIYFTFFSFVCFHFLCFVCSFCSYNIHQFEFMTICDLF